MSPTHYNRAHLRAHSHVRGATMRPCRCEWDVRVFGHAYCWTTRTGYWAKHVTCNCSACDCDCHKDQPHG